MNEPTTPDDIDVDAPITLDKGMQLCLMTLRYSVEALNNSDDPDLALMVQQLVVDTRAAHLKIMNRGLGDLQLEDADADPVAPRPTN